MSLHTQQKLNQAKKRSGANLDVQNAENVHRSGRKLTMMRTEAQFTRGHLFLQR